MDKLDILLIFMFVFGVTVSIAGFYDVLYVKPIASETANQYCMDEGFDFYESYSRIGVFSKEPVAIICKYVEQYRSIDLNINRTGEG